MCLDDYEWMTPAQLTATIDSYIENEKNKSNLLQNILRAVVMRIWWPFDKEKKGMVKASDIWPLDNDPKPKFGKFTKRKVK